MPLIRPVVIDSDQPVDIRQALVKLLKKVKEFSSKVDKIATEHELLKNQRDSFGKKMDADIANTELLIQHMAEATTKINDVSSKTDKMGTEHDLLKTQIDSIGNKMDADIANTELITRHMAEATTNVINVSSKVDKIGTEHALLKNQIEKSINAIRDDCHLLKRKLGVNVGDGESQNERYGERENEVPRKLLECYHTDNNWAALREGLEAILEQTSNAYIQLQSIEYDCVDPLYTAGEKGYLDLATVLLSHGVLLETVDPDGDTMLHGAAAGGHLPVVKLLLRRGATVDARNIYGRTPLMRAAEQGHVQVVTCLLRAGADKSAISSIGLTALDYATRERQTLAVQTLSLRPY